MTPPHRVPRGSNVLSLMLHPKRFLRSLQLRGSPSYLTGTGVYLAIPGEQIRGFFRNSYDLVPAPSLFTALTTFFGLRHEDFKVFEHGHISRFERQVGFRKDFAVYLRGDNLKLVMKRFLVNFTREILLDDGIVSREWAYIPDLYKFITTRIFRAEVEALYGERVFAVCPSFCEDFWAFYDAFPTCNENFDWDDKDLYNVKYEPVWGTQYIRKMVKRHEDLGFSDAGIASAMLGYLFVTTANTIPAALWMILYILYDEALTSRVRSEISTILTPTFHVDVTKLAAAPLLNSIYRETLRLRVASPVGRISSNPEFCLPGGWKVDPGVPIISTNWLGGLDDSFWNTGNVLLNGQPEHPVDMFWPERFLEYPGDSMSGPIRKPEWAGPATEAGSAPKTADDDRQARLVTAGLQGHWFPFGGGASRCPGEALAKQTILTSVVLVLACLEIELVDPVEAMKTGSRHRTLPFGSHSFNRVVPIRVRKR
ncbi:cytochrome P450 [Diplogelasinospora grovesii]|uniref:Cytochrome P450 n=1 Tax=Diplogelasinospora grovesii TaxID=303347 RepID=A0AAN6MVT4_9PEZI|nr:cytochrome P450 [Diplogelasinospora grovesii]